MSDPVVHLAKAIAVDKTLRKLEFETLLETMFNLGLLSKADAITTCLTLAEKARAEPVDEDMKRYRDQQALHYEDIAARFAGHNHMPR